MRGRRRISRSETTAAGAGRATRISCGQWKSLVALRREINDAGLEFEAIENFDPAHWHDVLLDGPKKLEHLENCKTIIRRLGEAGIPIMGYNFSIAGVCGRVTGRFARGEAVSVGMDGPVDTPMPRGMAWNMVDRSAGAGRYGSVGNAGSIVGPAAGIPRRRLACRGSSRG